MPTVDEILTTAIHHGATDVHMLVGRPVMYRIQGDLVATDDHVISPDDARVICYSMLADDQIRELEDNLDYDFIAGRDQHRFRVNMSFNQGTLGAVIRVLNHRPMPLSAIGLPPVVEELAQRDKGLVLVTGTTSQGKTTTLAAIIDHINEYRNKHIITIEDPVEYLHENKQSIIRQREIGKDTKTFNAGLRAALRQDPDVIVIGEMRDFESIQIALMAAESGVLVLSTLHTMSIDKVLERLLSYVPPAQEGQIRLMLSESLLGVIHQELLPTVTGGKRVACEILTNSNAVRNTIRNRETYHLQSYILTSERTHGMRSMKRSLDELLSAGDITQELYDQILLNY